ncbi:hypothetical protein MKX01_029318 [Papaver californicum]|nr:hypothetical protein MKX01_029318 [Papaver californicum]
MKLGVPRLVFYGMSNYVGAVFDIVSKDRSLMDLKSDDEPFTLQSFSWIKLTKNDFESTFTDLDLEDPHFKFVIEAITATETARGL